MQATNNDNPVLNNPYEEPKYYYDTVRGNLDYNKVLKGRRPYMGNIDITPSPLKPKESSFQILTSQIIQTPTFLSSTLYVQK